MNTKTLCTAIAAALTLALNASADVVYTYSYDASGNVVTIGADAHAYDVAGRVVLSETNGVRQTFGYDAFGNRTGCAQGPADCQYGHTVVTGKNQITGVSYDAAGNVEVLEGHHYAYDLLNVQTARDTGQTNAVEYVYTADDERIAVYTPGQGAWRWTLRDASAKVLREMTSHNGPAGQLAAANWTWSKDYIWRGDQLLASRQIEPGAANPNTYHYHLDHLGSPRRITNDADQIVGRHEYHAFGREVPGGMDEPSWTPLKFTGHERDGGDGAETLDYMHARYYSAMTGRFLSVDPGQDHEPEHPQSWNQYAYVRNNPIGNTDPDGRRIISGGASATVEAGFYVCVELNLNLDMRGEMSLTSNISLGGGAIDASVGGTFSDSPLDSVHDLAGPKGWSVSPTVGLLGQEISPNGSGGWQQYSLGTPSPLEAHGGAELTVELGSIDLKTGRDNLVAAFNYVFRDTIEEASHLFQVLRGDDDEKNIPQRATAPP